jgi:hypothetical protein
LFFVFLFLIFFLGIGIQVVASELYFESPKLKFSCGANLYEP